MRQFTCQYTTTKSLIEWIDSYAILDSNSVLIQIFSGILDLEILHNVTQTILDKLPQAILIGATTSGEIVNGQIQDQSIVISMSIFEKTSLKSMHLADDDSEAMGRDVSKGILDRDTKCIIMFADGLQCNGEALLRGVNSICPKEVIVAGGMSGDNGHFEKSYCIHGNAIFEKGVVAVALSSATLEVFHTYNLSWSPIGKNMKVTKSVGNVLFELDNQPVKDVYAKYLGANVVEYMPASTIEFPLIMHHGDVDIARSMISLSDNGGIVYAGEIPEGTNVRFGVGSPNMLRYSSSKTCKLAKESPIEGLFIYSCIARKTFLDKDLEAEFLPLSKVAPLAGFFTYGEFYHGSDDNKFLNITTTVLGLSETKDITYKTDVEEADFSHPNFTISALANLVEVTTQENEAYAKKLNYNTEQTQYYLDIAKVLIMALDNNKNVLMINQAGADILGYSKDEIIGKNFIENFIPKSIHTQVHDIASNIQKQLKISQSHINTVLTKNGDERVISWKNSTLYDKDGMVSGILTSGEDITEKVLLEKQLQIQARHAQMGEMISMIAHQWRQPLSAIASAVITVKMRLELESFDLTTQDGRDELNNFLIEKLDNIENYIENLTTTIDDFRNLHKPNKKAVECSFKQIVNKALKIVKSSMEVDNITIIEEYNDEILLEMYDNEMMQVILNILKNVQDNFKERNISNPEIKISSNKRSLIISDNGGGVPDDILLKIFDPYFSTKSEKNGTGLGLYMSKTIIENHHNGSIKVKNQNNGASFRINLEEAKNG